VTKELATVLGLPYQSLDRLWFRPRWAQVNLPEFQHAVRKLVEQRPEGLILDGNYIRKLDDTLDDSLTDLLWLDYPFIQYYPQLVWRTLLRLIGAAEPCAPGCHENWRVELFSRKSMLWVAFPQHSSTRNELIARSMKLKETGTCRVHRIQSKRELRDWLDNVKKGRN